MSVSLEEQRNQTRIRIEEKIAGTSTTNSLIVSEAIKMIQEEREKVNYLQKVLLEINNTPKVRGIGPIENSLNGVITKAEKVVECFNQ